MPIEGLLYDRGFNVWTELPDTAKYPVQSYTDTADTGDDYFATVFFIKVEKRAYIIDFIYTQKSMGDTAYMLSEKIMQHQSYHNNIERNHGATAFPLLVKKILNDDLKYFNFEINDFYQGQNKLARIFSNAPIVMNDVYFPPYWQSLYSDISNHLSTYTKSGKNDHDDIEDALSGVAEEISGNNFWIV